jgi:hypothetical protein
MVKQSYFSKLSNLPVRAPTAKEKKAGTFKGQPLRYHTGILTADAEINGKLYKKGQTVPKRQLDKYLRPGNISQERYAAKNKELRSKGKLHLAPSAPTAAIEGKIRAANARALSSFDKLRNIRAEMLVTGDSFTKTASAYGLTPTVAAKEAKRLGLLEKRNGRWVTAEAPFRTFTIPLQHGSTDAPVLVQPVTVDKITASFVGSANNRPEDFEGQSFHDINGEVFYIPSKKAAERAHVTHAREVGSTAYQVYSKTEGNIGREGAQA